VAAVATADIEVDPREDGDARPAKPPHSLIATPSRRPVLRPQNLRGTRRKSLDDAQPPRGHRRGGTSTRSKNESFPELLGVARSHSPYAAGPGRTRAKRSPALNEPSLRRADRPHRP